MYFEIIIRLQIFIVRVICTDIRNIQSEVVVIEFNTLTATSKSHVSLGMPREYFYYSKHIMEK